MSCDCLGCRRMNYTFEVLRDGSVVDTRELTGKDHHTMGRTPDNGAEPVAHVCSGLRHGWPLELGRICLNPHRMFAGCADIVLEHPSSSRLHAVIQFKATGEAFLYDAASAHGTFLNKRRLKPRQHEPLRLAPPHCTFAICGCNLSTLRYVRDTWPWHPVA